MKISRIYAELFPNNCPVLEYTADGDCVGPCTFYLKDGKTCPRHGEVKPNNQEYEEQVDDA